MQWHLIVDTERKAGAQNMAIDQSLLEAAQDGSGFLRLYQWQPPCLSFGRNEPAVRRYDRALIEQKHINVVRRPTGGRAVWHDREVTYAVAAPLDTFGSLRETYVRIHETIASALARMGADVVQASHGGTRGLGSGSCFAAAVGGEIIANGRKLVGSAQLRDGSAFLQHGSILLENGQNVVAEVSRAPHVPITATSLESVLARPVMFEEAREFVVLAARADWAGTWTTQDVSTVPGTGFDFEDPAWTWRR